MKNKKIAYLYLLITFFAWGSVYVVSKFVLGKIPTLTVSFMRFFIADIALFFVLKKRKPQKIEQQDYKYVLLIGFIGYFLSMGLQLTGTKLSNASLASLISSMNPITIMIFAAIILKEKFTIKKIASIILSIFGVYIVIGSINGDGQILGIFLCLLSVVLWSFSSIMVKRITQKYDTLQITAYSILVAVVCTLPFSAYELITVPNVQFDWKVVLSLLHLGLVCTALGNVLWNNSLSVIEAGTCSLFYPIQPMVGGLLGWMFLGEDISVNFILGSIIIIGGVLLSVLGKDSNA